MARGHRLNISIVLAAVDGLSGLFRAVPRGRAFTLSSPSPLSPSLISNLAPVDVKRYGHDLLSLAPATTSSIFVVTNTQTMHFSPGSVCVCVWGGGGGGGGGPIWNISRICHRKLCPKTSNELEHEHRCKTVNPDARPIIISGPFGNQTVQGWTFCEL